MSPEAAARDADPRWDVLEWDELERDELARMPSENGGVEHWARKRDDRGDRPARAPMIVAFEKPKPDAPPPKRQCANPGCDRPPDPGHKTCPACRQATYRAKKKAREQEAAA